MNDASGAEDVVYLRDGDTALHARIRRPPGAGPFPAVLHVHGGVWNNGSRFSDETVCRHLAEHGVIVASIDFRQAPLSHYPQSIADVHYGVRWLRANADRLGSRPDWVGGLGVSSGGHQLLLATLRAGDPRYRRLPLEGTPRLAYAVYLWPVTDPPARYRYARETGRDNLVALHDAYWGDMDAMVDGNPQRHLDELPAGSTLPPALLIYGSGDENIPEAHTERFAASYRAAGGRLDVRRYPDMPHGFIDSTPSAAPASADACEQMTGFISRHIGGS
jgi:acetyl esterase/lipase